MIYVNSRPLNPFARPEPQNRFHQFRVFGDNARKVRAELKSRFGKGEQVKRKERLFLIPGRPDVVTKIIDDDRFAMRCCVGESDGIEEWEEAANDSLPLPRARSAMVGARVPNFRAAVTSYNEPEGLSKGLSKRTRVYDSQSKLEKITVGEVTAYVAEQNFGGQPSVSVIFRADNADTLRAFIAELPVGDAQHCNISDHLLPSK